MATVAFVEWPDGLKTEDAEWGNIQQQVKSANPDILVTNEMPFGSWRPVVEKFNLEEAQAWVEEHDIAMGKLSQLDVAAIISSRPKLVNGKLVNEVFLLEGDHYQPMHQKHYFPSEEGWHEASWFETALDGFELTEIADLKVGVLLCTELMFTEKARHYGRLGANLIVSPRASGKNTNNWEAACAMASVTSGAYVLSSNRVGQSKENLPEFGGIGIAYAPAGKRIGSTDKENPIKVIDIDIEASRKAQIEYPCYLKY
ncbi:MAG: carbon-nitrogen hydrolase family protein [Emcibacteraceae bacterium]|nr:carbon-nitrogen hydrolase family protein [Emcibacteraceae bacterium]MDG1725754.1 carbon-nitrogen hydrolase family protein [Emcibacteraceae bacterium]